MKFCFQTLAILTGLLVLCTGPSHAQLTHPTSKLDFVRLVEDKDGQSVYEFTFPDARLARVHDVYQTLQVPFFDGTDEPGEPQLPKISYLFELPSAGATASLLSSEKHIVAAGPLLLPDMETTAPAGSNSGANLAALPAAHGWKPNDLIHWTYIGKMRDIPLYQLTLCPYRHNATSGLLEIHNKIRVRVSSPARSRTLLTEWNTSEVDRLLRSEVVNQSAAQGQRQVVSRTTRPTSLPTAANLTFLAGEVFVRLIVDQNGIYRLDYDQLRSLTGYNFAGVNPRTFRLFNRGLEVPLYVQGESDGTFSDNDYMEFFGEMNLARNNPYLRDIPAATGHYLDPWTKDNVYFLTWGDDFGLRMIEENGGIVSTQPARPVNFTKKVHFEEDNTRLTIANINLIQPSVFEDLWAYDEGIAYSKYTQTTQTSRDYLFQLDQIYTQFQYIDTLHISLQGISTGNPHRVDIQLNGVALTTQGQLTWSGKTKYDARISFSSAILHEGDNTLTIQTPVSTRPATDSIDAVALNWFEISYKRAFSAEDNYVEFQPDPGSPTSLHEFTLRNFSDVNISVYKKGVSKIVNGNYRRNSLDSTWQVVFQDDVLIEGVEYVAVEENAKLTPKRVVMDTSAALRTAQHNARYVIITPKVLRETALRLHDRRVVSGYTVETVDVEDIYDEFSGGVKNPWAIRDFLRFTYQSPNWQGSQGSPLYVTIIGDATDRPQKETSEYLVPLQHIQTEKFGPAASDYWFAMADDEDIVPDFFIGRLPVNSAQELSDIIDKIILYEQASTTGDWKNRIQYIGGSSETRGIGSPNQELPIDVFRYQCNSIINTTQPQGFSPDRIYAYPATDRFIGGANDVIEAFTDGRLIVNYLGHGGGFIWGDIDAVTGRPLLNNEQVSFFGSNGGRFPVVLSMTCFVGAFDATQDVLGELLLRTPGKGAIGVLASSGTGWIQGDYRLLRNSTLPLVQEDLTIGESIALGKLNYLIESNQTDFDVTGGGSLTQTYIPQSNVFQFNYLGDPGLKLRTPVRETITLSNYSPARNETLVVNGGCDFTSGSGRWEIYQMKPVSAVTYGRNEPTFTTLASGTFTISGANYTFGADLSQIPDTVLQDGYTGIRVFGETTDGRQSFNAFSDFAVNATYISEIQTLPATITSSDTIRFQAFISDPDQIASAVAVYDVTGFVTVYGLVDTLHPIGSQIYRTNGIPPLAENDVIRYRIRVFDGNGDSTLSLPYQTSVLAGIDLSLNPQNDPNNPLTDNIYIGGKDEVRINAILENRGYLDLQGVVLRFFNGHPQQGGVLLGEVTTDIAGSIPNAGSIARDTVSIVSPLTSGTHQIYVWVDPDSNFNDVNRLNNLAYQVLTINAFNVTPALGTTYSGTRNDTVALDAGLSLNIPPGAVSQNTILRIHPITTVVIQSQPDLRFVPTLGHVSPVGYQLTFERADELISNGKTIWTAFSYDTTAYSPFLYQDSIAVYRWDSGNKRWNLVGHDVSGRAGIIAVELSERLNIGLLALVISRDGRPPVIEPTIEGQFFSQGSIAPKNPKISAVLYDQNGVSMRKDRYTIKVDNDVLAGSQIILADSLANSNNVTLTLDLPSAFEPGDHSISFQAEDVCGNTTDEVLLNFRVVTKFDIKLVGNFPNPFTTTTTFVFRIEAYEPLDRLDIGIYTVSGRRIRRITSDDPINGPPLNSVGYHEVIWDAADDDGHDVANGIYFYRIKGKLNGKTVEKRGKIGYFR